MPSSIGGIRGLMKISSTAMPKVLLTLNIMGAFAYLFAASRGGWAIPEERAAGIYTTTGEPLVWFISILPIVATFFLIDFAWGVAIVTRRYWRGGIFWLSAAVVWLGAVVVDFAHH